MAPENFPSFGGAADLARLSSEELAGTLQRLQRSTGFQPLPEPTQPDEVVQELHVYRIELEMQNRALRETQAGLEESIRNYSDLYDHLPITYLTLTPEGRIVQANLAACTWLQRERTLLVGSFVRKFLDPYDSGRLAAHLEGCVQNGGPSNLEVTLRLPDGTTIAALMVSRLPAGRGPDRYIYTAITDISGLKKTQRLLEDINREQDTFNAAISHDLRAPLITISNYARIISTEHSEHVDDETRMMVGRIERAAARMERSLKQLQEYGTLAREEVIIEAVPLDQAVRNVLQEHQEAIKVAAAEITNECPAMRVRASRTILGLVLTNLLTNALKFVEQGTPPRVRITAGQDGEGIVLKIADQGIGIDEKYHRQIFQVFERLHGYSKYPGTGIGLAIARRGMERMNGRIWVESEPGKGSCFCVGLLLA